MEYLGSFGSRQFYRQSQDLIRVLCLPEWVRADAQRGGCLKASYETTQINNQESDTIRGSKGIVTTHLEFDGDCEHAQQNTLDVTDAIWLRWTSTPITSGPCAGFSNTTKERIICQFDTATGYGQGHVFSNVQLLYSCGAGEQVLGYDIPLQFRFYTGHADHPGQIILSSDYTKPDKNRMDRNRGGSAIGLHTFNLTNECLYPQEKTQMRICFGAEEDNLTFEQGGMRCDKFYPQLSYSVERKYMHHFWRGT